MLLGLSFDVLAGEREAGVLPLVILCPIDAAGYGAARVGAVGAILFVVVLGALALACGLSGNLAPGSGPGFLSDAAVAGPFTAERREKSYSPGSNLRIVRGTLSPKR